MGGVRVALFVACVGFGVAALGYETDPYTNRHLDIADSTAVLDRDYRTAPRAAAEGDRARAFQANEEPGQIRHKRTLTAANVDLVDSRRSSRRTPEGESAIGRRIRRQQPIRATRTARFFGFDRTIKLNDVLIGTDKIGHFFSQGRNF